MKPSRKKISFFLVEKTDGTSEKVIISQVEESVYGRNDNYSGKYLNLNSLNGPQVVTTNNCNIFNLLDGTVLRKIR